MFKLVPQILLPDALLKLTICFVQGFEQIHKKVGSARLLYDRAISYYEKDDQCERRSALLVRKGRYEERRINH
jgi:hypothetical protein